MLESSSPIIRTHGRLGAILDEYQIAPVNTLQLLESLQLAPAAERRSVTDILLSRGLISQSQVMNLTAAMESDYNAVLRFIDTESINEEDFQRAMACHLAVPYVDPTEFEIDPMAIDVVPAQLARDHKLIPLCFIGTGLVVAVTNPADARLRDVLALSLNHSVEFVIAARERIERTLARWYGPSDDQDVMLEVTHPQVSGDSESKTMDAGTVGGQRPTVRLVHNILMDAIAQRASDIHIRPLEKEVELLFRLDGVLVKIRSLPKSVVGAVVSRIKILGNMDIAERRVPQDGRIRLTRDGRDIDLRLSVIPTVQGESVVIRILDTQAGLKSIDDLGFSEIDQARFADLMTRTAGMVLVTGPTGCGKSTTLYAGLQQIKRQDVHIVTVENPVEYRLDGVDQIEINSATGFTFPLALRHILRHDPDVIMIGEIRDFETARIAVESALTGHLVLSTLHTNDAASAVVRLVEIGIAPYLINASLLGVLAQRLVRQNCSNCIGQETVPPYVRLALGVGDDLVTLRGAGCERCHGTGYRGRRAVYELLEISPRLRELIADGTSIASIQSHAVSEGMQPLTENALTLARAGATSLAEVYRIRLG